MTKLYQEFDATQFDPSQGSAQLPVGKHPVVISGSEVQANKENTGGYLKLDLTIIDGPHKGATGVYRLNLYNSNQQAVDIAHRQFSAVCHAIGVYKVQDSQQLHDRPFIIEVGFQKGQEPGSNPDAKGYTEVKRVFDRNGGEPGKPAQNPPAQVQGGGSQQSAPTGQWGGGQQFSPGTSQPPQGGAQTNQVPPAGAGGGWGGQQAAQTQTQAPAQTGGDQSIPAWARKG